MQIQNIDPNASSIGDEHQSDGNGVFTVPDQLAMQLVKFPHWRIYDGQPWPHEKTPEELEAERVAALVQHEVAKAQAQQPPKPKARSLGRRIVAAGKKAASSRKQQDAPKVSVAAQPAVQPKAKAKRSPKAAATKS